MRTNNTKQKQLLNQQVANWTVMYTKLHNYHWFVKGPAFFTLHAKFEELYNYSHETLDEVAERLLTIQGLPVATMAEALELATIKEETVGGKSANEMMVQLVKDLEQLIDELTELMTLSEEDDDQATADMALGIRTYLEKEIWLLSAYLGA
ncbi:starvation-inducible DNA-binding protein [Granulicatella balaenopterae]|uniref:Starvation-inducible DNA-binding protein n=1 Tax=Granulicatella balaenopterae TaxID=137733 RepID=A0A1H9NBQ3_9LACT|nr:DNA starvation/stationary phase protection protein [Granulicatella balaenopterae]SER33099.1 starvation-inducible DNA-binding protein [Granulicatella balaenopterae]